MDKLSVIAALAISLSSLASGYGIEKQDATSKIVGTWKSSDEVNGEPQAVVTIKRTDSKLGGTIIFRGLTVGGRENVILELPLSDESFDGTTFSFKVMFPAPEKMLTDWELKLRNDEEAGFSLIKQDGKPVEEGPSFSEVVSKFKKALKH